MDRPSSPPSPVRDEYDDPPSPPRSPSRLDFCTEDSEDDDESPMHGMDWSTIPLSDDYPYTFVDRDPFAIDTSPLDSTRLLIAEGDAMQATDLHSHDNTDIPPPFFAPPDDPMDQAIIEPRAPIPLRLPSVQIHVKDQESIPPSRTAIQRLNYPHHGFSRSALLQQKSLWSSRHEEWAEWQSQLEQDESQKLKSDTSGAYTGLATPRRRSPPPSMRAPPSGLERDLANPPSRNHGQVVQASVYPRVGDISALRDPYSVNIDRCFCKLPLWTLHKTLYAFDMQQRSGSLAPSRSASTLSSYSSGDEESDSTLVADSPVSKSQHPIELLDGASSPRSPPSWSCFRGLELSWYARWELLISLFRDRINRRLLDIPTKLESPFESGSVTLSSPEQVFRFVVGKDDDEVEDCGTLVTDSSFTVDFDEECERAMAFYRREMTCSEVAL